MIICYLDWHIACGQHESIDVTNSSDTLFGLLYCSTIDFFVVPEVFFVSTLPDKLICSNMSEHFTKSNPRSITRHSGFAKI